MDTVEEVTDQSLGFDDTISLDFDARFKRKIKLVSDTGYEFFLSLDKATTDGSFKTIPFPLTYMSVLAVPRSIAMSCEKKEKKFFIIFIFL